MVDSLAPRVDIDTLDRMTKLAQALSGVGSSVLVRNPTYRAVRTEFQVRFRAGEPFLYRRQQVQDALVRVLLAVGPRRGGVHRVRRGASTRSVLLDFVEELPFVDFVTDFKLFVETTPGAFGPDAPMVRAENPDEILASTAEHGIQEFTGA